MAKRLILKAADLQRIGISKPYAHQLVRGGCCPSLPLAKRIEAELGLPIASWPLPPKAANDPTPSQEAA